MVVQVGHVVAHNLLAAEWTKSSALIVTLFPSAAHVEPGLGALLGLVRVPAQVSSAFTLVIVTTVAFLVIAAGAVAELACLACAYDPLAIAAAVRINLQRCLSHADGGGSGDGTCPGEVIATTDDDARRP